jgi:hypothetical protein
MNIEIIKSGAPRPVYLPRQFRRNVPVSQSPWGAPLRLRIPTLTHEMNGPALEPGLPLAREASMSESDQNQVRTTCIISAAIVREGESVSRSSSVSVFEMACPLCTRQRRTPHLNSGLGS